MHALVVDDLSRGDLGRIAKSGQSRAAVALETALHAATVANFTASSGVQKKIIGKADGQSQ